MPSDTTHQITGMTVLVVEDDFMVADSLESLLDAWGAEEIKVISNVEKALSLLSEKQHYDVAILDINLKGKTIEPVALKLKEQGTPFIFVTGYGAPNMLPESLRDTPVLFKPVPPNKLIEAVSSLTAS